MLNVYSMATVLNEIRAGRKIEAMKQFRTLYGVGLKEGKDAVEDIEASIKSNPMLKVSEYLVVHTDSNFDNEYCVYECGTDLGNADRVAQDICNRRRKTYVVGVISESFEVSTKTMKTAA